MVRLSFNASLAAASTNYKLFRSSSPSTLVAHEASWQMLFCCLFLYTQGILGQKPPARILISATLMECPLQEPLRVEFGYINMCFLKTTKSNVSGVRMRWKSCPGKDARKKTNLKINILLATHQVTTSWLKERLV